MVKVYNKSVRPIGVANQSVLPDKEIRIQDKYAYCDVYDEDGNNTGKRQILPGLRALENMGFVTITEEEPMPVKDEDTQEQPKTKRGRKPKTEE